MNFLDYLASNSQQILFLTQAHFLVVLIAVGIGSAISVVLGLAGSTGEPDPLRFSGDWFACWMLTARRSLMAREGHLWRAPTRRGSRG